MRHFALLGGTTSWGDCLVALSCAANPFRLMEGPALEAYEQAFARAVSGRYAISFSAARVGLYSLLKALGVGSGDEVILQVPTHIVVANAIRYAGARPVYADCRLEDYNIDLADAERRITARTKVLLVQHTFGIPVDMDATRELAKRHNLFVIEDCVHSLGATYRGQPVGALGDASIFSTEETKMISTTMGGMVVTNDPALAGQMRKMQGECPWPSRWLAARYLIKLAVYHVLTQPSIHRYPRLAYDHLGRRNPLPMPTNLEECRGLRPRRYEQRLSNGQAAVGVRQLHRLRENLAHRARLAALYRKSLEPAGLRVPEVPGDVSPSWVRYPVWVEHRAQAIRALARHAVLGSWFTSVLEEAESPACGEYVAGSCPRAEEAARHLVNLPTHLRVTPADAEHLAAQLIASAGNTRPPERT